MLYFWQYALDHAPDSRELAEMEKSAVGRMHGRQEQEGLCERGSSEEVVWIDLLFCLLGSVGLRISGSHGLS